MREILSTPFNTSQLVALSSIITAIAWAATLAGGFVLYSTVGIGTLVVLLSAGWLVVTLVSIWFMSRATPDALKQMRVWRIWAGLSVAGCLVNIVAGLVVAGGFVGGNILITTAPMEYGVILPWLVVYTIGFAATGLSNWDNRAALSIGERVIYLVLGVASLLLAGLLAMMPVLHGQMIMALIPLSLIPVVTVYFR